MTSTRACHAYLYAAMWNVEVSAAARKQVREMETYEVRSCVRGHHVFKSVWNPIIGQQLVCKRETNNPTDVYAVAVMRGSSCTNSSPDLRNFWREFYLAIYGQIAKLKRSPNFPAIRYIVEGFRSTFTLKSTVYRRKFPFRFFASQRILFNVL